MRNTIFILLLYLLSFRSDAQTDSVLLAERFVQLNYDNDFFSATDRYYTQGIYLKFVLPINRKSILSKLLIPLQKQGANDYGIQLRQDVFTPRSIRHDSIYFGERPYAALFYLTHELISTDFRKQQRLVTQFDLGIIGPYAKGEEEQKGIHKALNNIEPLGWQYQLTTDYVINYNVRFEKGLINKKYLNFIAAAEVKVGTLYDLAAVGMILRFGKMEGYFEEKRKMVHQQKGKFKFYFLGRIIENAVAYNATLQGGVFNKDIYTLTGKDLDRVVTRAEGGVVLAWQQVQLEFTKIYLSPEFKNGLDHGWGHCAISVHF